MKTELKQGQDTEEERLSRGADQKHRARNLGEQPRGKGQRTGSDQTVTDQGKEQRLSKGYSLSEVKREGKQVNSQILEKGACLPSTSKV